MRNLDSTLRAGRRLLAVWLLAVAGARAQAPAPDPNLDLWDGGAVKAIVELPDGSVIVGGDFLSVYFAALNLSVTRQGLAKFDAAGNLDLGWSPAVQGTVNALAVDPAGALYAAGSFSAVNGVARNGLVKLASTGAGAVDAAWDPAMSNCDSNLPCVAALAAASDGVYVGGVFTFIGGQARNGLAKLVGANGQADTTWNPNPALISGSGIDSIALAPGAVYVAGVFTAIGGQSRVGVAKLSPTGTGQADAGWNANSDTIVRVVHATGTHVYAAGLFATIGGASRAGVARLSPATGQADPAWNPGGTNTNLVRAIAVDAAGGVYLGGDFTSVGGVARRNLAKLSGTTGLVVTAWEARTDAPVQALVAGAGPLHAGGGFESVATTRTLGYAGLATADAAIVRTANLQDSAQVLAIVAAPGGSTFVGGRFARADGLDRVNVLKLQPDGRLDRTWSADAPSSTSALTNRVSALEIAPDGSVLVGGSFDTIGGVARANLAKVSTTTPALVDPAWNPAPDLDVRALAALGASVFVGGSFTTIAGQPRRALAKVDATSGALDAIWVPQPLESSGDIGTRVTVLRADAAAGAIYAAGTFDTIGGASRRNVARLSPSGGGAADAWDPQVSACNVCVEALAVGTDDAVYLGGTFLLVGATSRPYLARVSKTGTGAPLAGWTPQPNESVYALELQGTSLLVGGVFTAIASGAQQRLAKLDATTGLRDPAFTVGANGQVLALESTPTLAFVGGVFTQLGTTPRAQLASVSIVGLFSDGFE